MNKRTILLRAGLIAMLLSASARAALPIDVLPGVEMNVKQEKMNMLVHFERAAVAGFASADKADGFAGYTADFGGTVQALIAFDASVSEATLLGLIDYQGRLQGTALCKRVRFGSSERFPGQGIGVVADQCTLKSVHH